MTVFNSLMFDDDLAYYEAINFTSHKEMHVCIQVQLFHLEIKTLANLPTL